jgi:hypothetical protein
MSRELLQQALVHLENACMPAPSFLAEIRSHLAAQPAPVPDDHGFDRTASHTEDRYVCFGESAAPVPVPLTDEQIDKILERERMRWITAPPTYEFACAFARAVERAHGIGIAASPEKP